MAEIKIEKKKPVWPWILLILVVLAIVAFLWYQNQASDDYPDDYNDEVVDDTSDTLYNDAARQDSIRLQEYGTAAMTSLMESIRDSTRFGTDSTYTKSALNSLARLTVSKAKTYNLGSSAALADLEQYADMEQTADSRTAETGTLENTFKEVSDDVVTVISALRDKMAMPMEEEVENLKATSDKLSSTTALSKQQTTIQTFFRQAHDILHDMNP